MHHILRPLMIPRARLTLSQRIVVMLIFVLLITALQYMAWAIDKRVDLLCYAPLGLAAAFMVVYGYEYALIWIVILTAVRAISLDTPNLSILISPVVHLISISAFAFAWKRAGLKATVSDARDTVTMLFLLLAGAVLHVVLVILFTRLQYLPGSVPTSPVAFLTVILAGYIYVTPIAIMVLLPLLNGWLGAASPGPTLSIRSIIPKRRVALRAMQALLMAGILYLLTLPETYAFRASGLVLIPILWITLQDGLPAGMLSALVINLGITIIWQTGLVPDDALFSLRMQLIQTSILAILTGSLVNEWRASQQAYEQRMRLMESIQDAVIITDPQAIITHWSPGAQRLYGWTAAETVGQDFRAFIRAYHGMDEREIEAQTDRMRAQGYLEGVYTQVNAEGNPLQVSMHMAVSYDDDGNRQGMIVICRDISEMVYAQESLRQSEAQYRELFLSAQRAMQELELLGRVRSVIAGELELQPLFQAVCESIADVFGYTLVSLYLLEGETLILQHQVGYNTIMPHLEPGSGVISRAVSTGKAELIPDVRLEPQFLAAAEDLQSEVVAPLFDRGEVVGALNIETQRGMVLDQNDVRIAQALGQQISAAITRARLYSQVLQSEVRFRSLIENGIDMITMFDKDGVMVYNSPSVLRIHGIRPEDIKGQTIGMSIHPDNREYMLQTIENLKKCRLAAALAQGCCG